MVEIKFSHKYLKMAIQTECVELLQIFIVNDKELAKNFIEYDTAYLDTGKPEYYQLPKGKLIILLFHDNDNEYLFTTIRRWTPQKEKYYRSMQGKMFDVILTSTSLSVTSAEGVKWSYTLIEELKEIRVRLTQIYMVLGNPKDCPADMILKEDIAKFEKSLSTS